MTTLRCKGSKGCGKWLAKLDDGTLEIVERRRFVMVFDMKPSRPRPPIERDDDGRIILDVGDPGDPGEPSLLSILHARGVHVGAVPEVDDRPVDYRIVRCNCGAHYNIPPQRA